MTEIKFNVLIAEDEESGFRVVLKFKKTSAILYQRS